MTLMQAFTDYYKYENSPEPEGMDEAIAKIGSINKISEQIHLAANTADSVNLWIDLYSAKLDESDPLLDFGYRLNKTITKVTEDTTKSLGVDNPEVKIMTSPIIVEFIGDMLTTGNDALAEFIVPNESPLVKDKVYICIGNDKVEKLATVHLMGLASILYS